MSQFIDKLTRLSGVAPQPLGFRTQPAPPPKPQIQLVISVTETGVEPLADYLAGADAGLWRISTNAAAKRLQEASQAVSGIPWGGWLQGDGWGAIKQVTQAGGDFIVFPAITTPLAILPGDAVGKILEVEVSLGEGWLRTVNKLPVDAVLVAGEPAEGRTLTWQHLMLFRCLADLLTKPLLVTIPSRVTGAELQALWEAGVKAVVIEISAEQPQDKVKELRQMIDKLTFPSPRQRERIEPRLFPTGRESSKTTIEEEKEEP